MNFEFKSTFNKSIHGSLGVWSFVVRLDHSFWILTANTTAFTIPACLYLENVLIPGTYASGPFGNELVELFMILAKLFILSSGYSILRLVNNYLLPANMRLTRTAITRRIDAVRDYCHAIVLGLSVRVCTIRKEPRHLYTPYPTPKTYISTKITV